MSGRVCLRVQVRPLTSLPVGVLPMKLAPHGPPRYGWVPAALVAGVLPAPRNAAAVPPVAAAVLPAAAAAAPAALRVELPESFAAAVPSSVVAMTGTGALVARAISLISSGPIGGPSIRPNR